MARTFGVELVALRLQAVQVLQLLRQHDLALLDFALVVRPQRLPRGGGARAAALTAPHAKRTLT